MHVGAAVNTWQPEEEPVLSFYVGPMHKLKWSSLLRVPLPTKSSLSFLFPSFFKVSYYIHAFMCVDKHKPLCAEVRGQQCSPSTVWIPGIKEVINFGSKPLYLLSHPTNTLFLFSFWDSVSQSCPCWVSNSWTQVIFRREPLEWMEVQVCAAMPGSTCIYLQPVWDLVLALYDNCKCQEDKHLMCFLRCPLHRQHIPSKAGTPVVVVKLLCEQARCNCVYTDRLDKNCTQIRDHLIFLCDEHEREASFLPF